MVSVPVAFHFISFHFISFHFIYHFDCSTTLDDCGDLSDEPIGCIPKECKKNQFKCKTSNRCIPRSSLCNGVSECKDNSDEDPLLCNSNKTEHCSTDEFECANKICISSDLICNGKGMCVITNRSMT